MNTSDVVERDALAPRVFHQAPGIWTLFALAILVRMPRGLLWEALRLRLSARGYELKARKELGMKPL